MNDKTDNGDLDLVVVGEAPLDVMLDAYPPVKRPGGVSYSACAAAARRARVGIVSDIGSDEIGGFLTRLVDLGVDVRGIEKLGGKGVGYLIRNSNEVLPQIVTPVGVRFRDERSSCVPNDYLRTRSLLLYPYKPDLLTRMTEEVRKHGGRIFF